MKRWIHSENTEEIEASEEPEKLKRTPESGHSYDESVVFETVDDMMKWWEEDSKYED